ncbi:hypothetical protein NQ315_004018 [Exocentrus adspersus]|uniref:Secreted protein n=1 Tax=Exocentrus adspersus TaxID=1586481 RepID=A0AAV8V721_9CUCU|nr:hypothetical protein NQ315_004018 [Exocentrus adspersus]
MPKNVPTTLIMQAVTLFIRTIITMVRSWPNDLGRERPSVRLAVLAGDAVSTMSADHSHVMRAALCSCETGIPNSAVSYQHSVCLVQRSAD